jgi:hypothetical protein
MGPRLTENLRTLRLGMATPKHGYCPGEFDCGTHPYQRRYDRRGLLASHIESFDTTL